jgi:hypothetical protein
VVFIDIAGVAAATVLAGLSAIHLYWAFGGRRGQGAVVPTVAGRPRFSPSRTATVVVAALLALSAVLVVGGVRGWPPRFVFRVGAAGVGLVLIARAVGEGRYLGFFKRERETEFACRDTWLYSPLCLVLGSMAVTVALGA